MKNNIGTIKTLFYRGIAYYAVFFTFQPLINPGIGHWKNVLFSLLFGIVVTLGVYFFNMSRFKEKVAEPKP